MITERILLAAIGSTEASTFSELCEALGGDLPEGKSEWRLLFEAVTHAEAYGYIEVERGETNRIESLILTELGLARVRELNQRGK